MSLVKIGITFSLIERISTEIKRDKTSIIVVVPCPQFLRMLEHGIVSVLQKANYKLLQIQRTGWKHPLWKKLQLIPACLPGVSKRKDYCLSSSMSSWYHGDQVRRQLTTDQWRNAWSIVEDGLPSQHHTVSEVLDFLHASFTQRPEYSAIKIHLSSLRAICYRARGKTNC